MAPVFKQFLSFHPSLRCRKTSISFFIPVPNSLNPELYYGHMVRKARHLFNEDFAYTNIARSKVYEVLVLIVLAVGDGKWVVYYTGHVQQPALKPIHSWDIVGVKVRNLKGTCYETYPHYTDLWCLLPKYHWLRYVLTCQSFYYYFNRKYISSQQTTASKKAWVLNKKPCPIKDDQSKILLYSLSGKTATANGVRDDRHPYQETGWKNQGVFTKWFPEFKLWYQAQFDSSHVVSNADLCNVL